MCLPLLSTTFKQVKTTRVATGPDIAGPPSSTPTRTYALMDSQDALCAPFITSYQTISFVAFLCILQPDTSNLSNLETLA